MNRHVREAVEGDIGEEPLAIPWAGLEGVDRALVPYKLRRHEGEDASIGADVDDAHAGTDELRHREHLVGLVAAVDIRALTHVAQEVVIESEPEIPARGDGPVVAA